MSKYDFFRQYISSFIAGTNADAIINTLADELGRQENLAISVNNQLSISTASEQYLDKRLAELGITRPADLGIGDFEFRNMGIQINSTKQITEILHTVLATFYGDDSVRAYTQSNTSEPYVLAEGMDLLLVLENGEELKLTIKETDFEDIQAAKAQEVADAITRFIKSHNLAGYGQAFTDQDTGESFVRIYGGAKGPYSSIKVLGGSLQSKLEFPTIRATDLNNNDTTWEITRTAGSTLRLRWTGVGNAPLLDQVIVGDRALIYGSQFSNIGIYGTFDIVGVRPPQTIGAYDAGYFEIEVPDFSSLKSSVPNQAPPPNQPATPWNGFSSYAIGDIVIYGPKNYEALQANTGQQPDTSPTFWAETTKTGNYYTITVAQSGGSAGYDDLKFFSPKQNTAYNHRYALAFEPAGNKLKIYMPATTKVIKRDLVGAAHLHAAYSNEDLTGSFGHATDAARKIEIINLRSFKYPQNGLDNIAFGGEITYGLTTKEIDYVQREGGYTTVVCAEDHGLTGVINAFGKNLSSQVVSVAPNRSLSDDPDNKFLGPYAIDPNATYTLSDTVATTKEKVTAGENKSSILVKGYLPNVRGNLLFDLNQDTQEGPVPYLASQTLNAPITKDLASISQNGTSVTAITVSAHGAVAGSQVLISGTTNFNGVWTIDSVPSTTTYKFTKTPGAVISEVGVGTSATLLDGAVSTVILDPSYRFTYSHAAGSDVTLLEDTKAYEPSPDGADYGAYVTGTAEAREYAQKLINDVVAAGINLEIIIVFPGDVGLGYYGGSDSYANPPTSEKVVVWGV